MPKLSVPKSYQAGIKALLALDQSDFGTLVAGLRGLPESKRDLLRPSDVHIPGRSQEEVSQIINVVDSLYRVWSAASDVTLDAFVDDLLAATKGFYPAGQSENAKMRFRTVLGVEPIARSAKALAVSTDHQRIFSDAKILTDIRYAFRPDPNADPFGATFVHVLKIHYHEDGEHKNFFVALDDDDLKTLMEVVDRARIKEKRLRRDLTRAGVPYLGKENE